MKKTTKKFLIAVAFFFAGIIAGNAQEIGVRFGNVSAGNVAIDGIFSTGDFNRLHADVSFGNVVAADLLWDFFYRPLSYETLNWYMGAGPYLGIIEHDGDNDFNLGGAFEIGLEYRFTSVPISIGLDYRPRLEIIDNTNFHLDEFGLNIRYVFN